jgi:hypothetical protein
MRILYLFLCFSLLVVGCSNTESLRTEGLNELTKRYGKTFEVKKEEIKEDTNSKTLIWNAEVTPKDLPDISFQITVQQEEGKEPKLQYEDFLETWWNTQIRKDIEPKVKQLLKNQTITIFANASGTQVTYPDGKLPTIAELRKEGAGYPKIIVGIDMNEKLTAANVDQITSLIWNTAQTLHKNQLGDLYLYIFAPEDDPKGPIYFQQRVELISLEGIKDELSLKK